MSNRGVLMIKITELRVRTKAAAAVLAVLSLGAVGLATPASATDDSRAIAIQRVAGVYSNGAAVVVEIGVLCGTDTEFADLSASISQSTEGGSVTGSGYTSVHCTGSMESVLIAMSGYQPFGAGLAFVTVQLNSCSEFACSTKTGARNVRVKAGQAEQPDYDGDSLTLSLPRHGTIEAHGAGAIIEVPYTCDAGLQGTFEATLAQVTTDGYVTWSYASAGLTCSDLVRNGTLAFRAEGPLWRQGNAFVILNGYACGFECEIASAFRSVRLA
jgi:hypothetical protein